MSESDALRALMEADRWIERVTTQKTHLPEILELAALEGVLRGLLKELHEAEADVAPLRRDYDTAERESKRLSERALALDKALDTSTASARELSAIQHELIHVRELLSSSEDKELELLEELTPREEGVRTIKDRAQPGVARRVALIEQIAQLQNSLDDELVSLRASRSERVSAITSTLLARYDTALARAGTSGAAQVIEGRCDGCRLALSPLDVDRFKAQSLHTFMDCPSCGRLLLP